MTVDLRPGGDELGRVSSGVYQLRLAGQKAPRLLSGKLYHVLERVEALGGSADQLYYLKRDSSTGMPEWCRVDPDIHEHYTGEQQRTLLAWMYQLDCPKSNFGHKRFAYIVNLNPSRIADALRHPASKHYKPLSSAGMLYIEHQVAISIHQSNRTSI